MTLVGFRDDQQFTYQQVGRVQTGDTQDLVHGHIQGRVYDGPYGNTGLPFPRELAVTKDDIMRDLQRLEELVWLKDRTSEERESNPIDKYSNGVPSFHGVHSETENAHVPRNWG